MSASAPPLRSVLGRLIYVKRLWIGFALLSCSIIGNAVYLFPQCLHSLCALTLIDRTRCRQSQMTSRKNVAVPNHCSKLVANHRLFVDGSTCQNSESQLTTFSYYYSAALKSWKRLSHEATATNNRPKQEESCDYNASSSCTLRTKQQECQFNAILCYGFAMETLFGCFLLQSCLLLTSCRNAHLLIMRCRATTWLKNCKNSLWVKAGVRAQKQV